MSELCIRAMILLLGTMDDQQDAHNNGWDAKVETYATYIQQDITNVNYHCNTKEK